MAFSRIRPAGRTGDCRIISPFPSDRFASSTGSIGCKRNETTEIKDDTEKMNKQDPLTGKVIGCAIEVHRLLGPGLLESAYEQCLAYELDRSGIEFQLQVPIPIAYKTIKLDCEYRIDVLIEGQLILELKAVDEIKNIHKAQILTYMKLASISTGLLINFNTVVLKDGIIRFKI